jgi:hypothetical protein
MSDLQSIMRQKAQAHKGNQKPGSGPKAQKKAAPTKPGSVASSSHSSMPEVPALAIRKPPSLSGSDATPGKTPSLSEYMAARRSGGSQYAGSATGSVRSVETTQSMIRMSEALEMNRKELTDLRRDNKEIKELLAQLLAAQISQSGKGQKVAK